MADVTDNAGEQRFELVEQGHVAHADYEIDGDVVVFTHTIVPPALRGTGVGSRLVEGALAQVRASGRKVRPLCSFVARYIAQHSEWADLREG
ncbi:GNAT family N-acetyltransferase [Sphingomonas hengshuiensis]|uniref:Acetyltransferase n=1 Tax=Sphingomonas hengshuiensis TaxID=1609977 RepID=A0A7U4JB79_9SPHN|nr:GNAT family N-acetyltransferase [Sphingomonas hengshuiensis]AJP73621.1 acetyltransferase [Sphingomonas hengshuiensis]